MQALPRRLALDFRDVFQEGFAFTTSLAMCRSPVAWRAPTTCACAVCRRRR